MCILVIWYLRGKQFEVCVLWGTKQILCCLISDPADIMTHFVS
jgi:hypothetical protein